MRVVYIDSLFLLNLTLDYLTLLLAGRFAGEVLHRLRLFVGALFGSLYAVSLFWPGWPFLAHPLLRLAMGVVMVLTAYGSSRRLLRVFLLFLAAAALMGGCIYALSYLGSVELIHGVPAPTLDLRLLLLGAAGGYGILSMIGRKRALHGFREYRKVEISLGGVTAVLTALVDNGNTLTDPVTGRPVMVAEGSRLERLLPPGTDIAHPVSCFARGKARPRFRLLPYRSVGVDRGLLLAVVADAVTIDGRACENRLVALSPTPVSESGAYQALLYHE